MGERRYLSVSMPVDTSAVFVAAMMQAAGMIPNAEVHLSNLVDEDADSGA